MKTKFQLVILLTLCSLSIKINAQIYYQDISPDVTLSTWNLKVINIDTSTTASLSFSTPGNLSIWEEFDSRIVVNVFSDCEVLMNGYFPAALNFSQLIASTGTWVQPAYAVLNDGTQGNWIGVTDKYLGVRIKTGIQWLYGWIRMDVNTAGTSVTIKDYACNRTPNTSINAGQTTTTRINNFLDATENIISIYPNPSNGAININGINGNVDLRIINIQGKVVFTEELISDNQSYTQGVDLSAYPKGIYFIKLTNKNFTKVEKVVFQ